LLLLITVVVGAVAVDRARAAGPFRPPLPLDRSPTPLGTPRPAPAGSGGYRVLEVQDDGSGRPVRWDPCRPIHYVVRLQGEPPGGALAVETALRRVEAITGLRFVSDGTSDEVPRPGRPPSDPQRYGSRWSPVLIAWTTPREYPDMDGYAGLGGPEPVAGDQHGTERYVSGVVLLNADHLAEVMGWPGGPDRVTAVVTHELGHLVGLDHVDDPHALMYARPSSIDVDPGAGDLRGFAAVSGGPCFDDF
jgi:hypothetical protein